MTTVHGVDYSCSSPTEVTGSTTPFNCDENEAYPDDSFMPAMTQHSSDSVCYEVFNIYDGFKYGISPMVVAYLELSVSF